MKEPLVSICCMAYNHASYIRQCLDGFMMQKTNFLFEVLIHDDASTDGTQEIIREYADRYPELINPIYQIENQYSKGISPLRQILFPMAKGKYIALCEGDDYWIDPLKLQKQVDFLESHNELTFCVHRYKRFFVISNIVEDDLHPGLFLGKEFLVIDNNLFKRYWLTQPLTALIRRDLYAYIVDESRSYRFFRDINTFYFLLKKGNGGCMNFYGGVYNIHGNGVQSGLNVLGKLNANFNVIKELCEKNPLDEVLKYKIANIIIMMLKQTGSITPLLCIGKVNVSLRSKLRIFSELISQGFNHFIRKIVK